MEGEGNEKEAIAKAWGINRVKGQSLKSKCV